jgi:uncharacterized protein with von Willebrand factor type A (vWA) domain
MADFDRFIYFSAIADEQTRKRMAESIFERLQNTDYHDTVVENNFTTAIDNILNHKTLCEMCNGNAELSETVASDILNFVDKTHKQIVKTENPFAAETQCVASLQYMQPNNFDQQWQSIKLFINKTYDKNEIDTDFYEQEFQYCFNKNDKKHPAFDSIKEHLTDKWNELLFRKRTDWKLKIIDKERKKFCEELYAQIEDLQKLQDALAPFTNELGRLWDMSKNNNWGKIDFDVLKRYAYLLQKDKSLNELAEMLGRMHQAEQEMEEEIFAGIKLTTVWKIENSAKSDLIGVYESDDISNALPSEFALLADPATETVFYRKFAEKKLQTFEYQGRTQEIIDETFENKRQKIKEDKKGPFIICIDTSGSMHGTPETVAKTLCFAILKIAIRENRKCYLISFSTGIETLNLTSLKNSLDKVIRFLSMSFHGGTDATPAMRESLRMLEIEDYKKADVIMVSDFVMPAFDEETQKQIDKAKENNTKFHSLVIGTSQNKGVTKDFDSNWLYDVNNRNGVLGLVKNIQTL